MSHEIEQHDGLVLHKQKAWHGLGTIVENAPTPREGLKLANLDWEVEQWPLSATNGEKRIAVNEMVLNIRSDRHIPLGVVGVGYKPIQNAELADFCEALAEQGDTVRIETAGSIRNGQKVWFLLKGESFSVRARSGDDELSPYILVSNGHDGGTALRCTPTTIRVVCKNTLSMVIPGFEHERNATAKPACFVARHTGDIRAKVEDAKAAMMLYGKSLSKSREVIDHLAARDVNSAAVQAFFLECFTKHFGAVPTNPQNSADKKKRDRAMKAVGDMGFRFAKEHRDFGASAWTAFNSYSGWLQHDQKMRGRNFEAKMEARTQSNLFGVNAERTLDAMAMALAI